MNTLDQLKQYTKIVVDSSDFYKIKDYKAQDATTNPSLILKSVQKKEYQTFFKQTVKEMQGEPTINIVEQLLVNFGKAILKVIPGRVSTEVDARLSFNIYKTINAAYRLINLYENQGINRKRVLIKIASTWEGIQAAKILQKENINCNMTLLFTLPQAVVCGNVNAALISPFVGRIYDFYKNNLLLNNKLDNNISNSINDPGIQLINEIFYFYKKIGYQTEIMGASFRNISQILELAGCDLLTISPVLLQKLKESNLSVERKLHLTKIVNLQNQIPDSFNESEFRLAINNDIMATEKLSEGIRNFISDTQMLEKLIVNSQ